MDAVFPEIKIEGAQVRAHDHVEPGTTFALLIATMLGLLGLLIGILVTYGILLLVLLFYPLYAWYLRRKALALIHGSGVLIGERQMPEIHACAEVFKKRLGVPSEVSVYLVEDNIANAFAVRYGKKNVILLTDDLIQGCLMSGNPKALSFVLAHELGHIALNHVGVLRSWVGQHYKKLSRLDEYSADAVACALVEDRAIAQKGLLLLTVGYAMMPYIDLESLAQQAKEVATNRMSKRAERHQTHPLLLNRFYRMLAKRS